MKTKFTQLFIFLAVIGILFAFSPVYAQAYPNAYAKSHTSGHGPENVFEDWQTYWESVIYPSAPEWIRVDYGSTQTFNTVTILWRAEFAKYFNIKVSNDAYYPPSNWTTVYTTTNGGSGLMMIPIGMTEARHVEIECTCLDVSSNHYQIAIINTSISYPYGTAESESGHEAYKALDRDLATSWRSTAGGEQSITFTYDEPESFCYMTLIWGDASGGSFASSYTVEMSNDEVEWDEVYTTDSGDGEVDDFWLDQIDWVYDSSPGIEDWFPKKYKYVRLNCIDAPGGSEYELREYRLTMGNRYPHAYSSEAWERQDNPSPDEGYKYCANMVLDGNLTDESPDNCSRWASGNSSVFQWFYVDLGSVQTFSQLKIYWHDNAACDDYYIYGSQDGRVWGTPLSHETSTTGDIDVISFPETSARFVKINFQSIMNYAYSIVEMYIIPGAIATSNWSYAWGDEVPFKAVDGNLDTAWSSTPFWGNDNDPGEYPLNEDDQLLTIDYGNSGRTFDTVVLNWADCYAKEYKIEISDTLDNPSWEIIKTVTNSDGDADVIYFNDYPRTTKYLRVNLIDWGIDNSFYSLKEIKAEMKSDFPVIDYGSLKDFNKVIIKWDDLTDVESFRILTSNDQVNWTVRHTKDNVGKGLTVLPVGTISAQYLKIECKKSGIWTAPWTCMIGEVTTYFEYPFETVSSSQGYEGFKAMDNDLDTIWRSSGAGTQTFALSYEDVTKICFATIIWGDSYATSYSIEMYHPEREAWEEVYSTEEGDGGIDDLWLDIEWEDQDLTDDNWIYTPTEYQYLRIICTQSSGTYYEIRELRVTFGNQYPLVYASEAWKNADRIDDPYWQSQYCPGFVINGGLVGNHSRWASANHVKNQWVYIDFGKDRTFDEMNIYWYEGHGCDDYVVSGSQDGKTWYTPTLIDKTSTLEGLDMLTLSETTARFLKVQMDNIINRPYSIKEIYIIPGVLGTSCRSDEWGPQVPYKALDEDLTTCWSSIPPWGNWDHIPSDDVLNNQSITIDYGQDKNTFNTVILQWDSGHAKTYSLNISDDLEDWTTIYPTGAPIIEDGGTDLIELDNDKTAQYLKVCCTERKNEDSNYTILEVITELRTRYPFATADSTQNGLPASNAVDDSDETRWGSDWVPTAEITIDYGALRRFDEVRLLWEAAYAISYQIQISNDEDNWTIIYSTTSGDGGEDIITLAEPVVARYVKMYATERALPAYGYSLYDFSTRLTTPPVQLDGKQLTLEGEPFFAKGVCYGATPVGSNHNYDWSDDEDMYTTDLQLLQDMGCNVIRLYKPPLYAAGMDAAYEHGIYALMGYDISQNSDITDQDVRDAFKTHFLQMVEDWKDHPAVYMWAIANEMNVHVPEVDKPAWYSLVNECAVEAKLIDSRPVTTVGVEVGDVEPYDPLVPNLDVWSVNIYRGQHFWNLFALGEYYDENEEKYIKEYVGWTAKPMLITEFGCDVYHTWNKEEFDIPQAEYSRNWWIDMIANSSAINPDKPCLGGTLFQFADDWNKQANPGVHDMWCTGGCGNLYDTKWGFNDEDEWVMLSNWEDEWAGIVGIAPDTCEKDLREAYFALQDLWAAETHSDNFENDSTYQTAYSWHGDSYTYDYTNKWINTYAGSGSAHYVSMSKNLDSVDASVQTDFCFTNTDGSGQAAIRAFVRSTPDADPGTQDGYCGIVNIDDDGQIHASLYRINNGTWHYLVDSNVDNYRLPKLGEWHTIRLSVRQTTLTLFMDGSLVTSYIDRSHVEAITSAGDVSIQPIHGDADIDNYFAIRSGYGIRFDRYLDPITFNDYEIEPYGAGQDITSTITFEDIKWKGRAIHITGNAWKKIAFPYKITPTTILEFEFKSEAQGEIHGIGFDTDDYISSNYTFKVYGTQNWGISTYNNYSDTAPEWKSYKIPIGQHYTGNMTHLFLVNDHDVGSPTAESMFINIKVYEAAIDFGEYDVVPYGAGQDISGIATLKNDDSTVCITGNGWKRISFPYTVTANTVLEFDFRSSSQGDIQGIGFDNNDYISSNYTFKVYGTQTWGISTYNNYSDTVPGIKHYKIPVGQYYTGNMIYLFFVNDHDVGSSTAESRFTNILVYEAPPIDDSGTIDFYDYGIAAYGAGQDINSTATVKDNGSTLNITGNGWKRISFPYTVTANTVIEFDFKSSSQGDIQGIGLDNNDYISSNYTFKVYGTQTWGISTYNNYSSTAPSIKHYKIPIGQHYAGNMIYLFFVNDHDVGSPTAESEFSNVIVYEE